MVSGAVCCSNQIANTLQDAISALNCCFGSFNYCRLCITIVSIVACFTGKKNSLLLKKVEFQIHHLLILWSTGKDTKRDLFDYMSKPNMASTTTQSSGNIYLMFDL